MDRSSIKKSRTKMTPKNWIGFLYSLSLSVCLFVCLSVASLQVTVFVVGSWILARGTLEWIPQFFICFLKCWDLIYLLLFLDFFGVFFAISSINFERVCRPNQMTQRLEMPYMGSLYGHLSFNEIFFQYYKNNFQFCSKNLHWYKDSHFE